MTGTRHQREAALVLGLLAVVLLVHGVHGRTPDSAGVAIGVALVARGQALGRPLRSGRLLLVALIGLVAVLQSGAGYGGQCWADAVLAGAVLALPAPPPAPAGEAEWAALARLVDRTADDPLAPFALRTDKAVLFAPGGGSALAYRVRFGIAVASGDPVGDPGQAERAVEAFVTYAGRQGWRVAALGTARPQLWRPYGLRAVPIGRDVVLDVPGFTPSGRRFRNLRQAAARARNAGVVTAVLPEAELRADERRELRSFAAATRGLSPRGFSMILDHPLDGTHPGAILAVARDRSGRPVALQRFAAADHGRELSLDIPWRAADAPNGVDELLALDLLAWARRRDGRHVSLAFAAFPELFAPGRRRRRDRLARAGIRLFDRFIDLRRLYRYLRKYHAFGRRRYVALAPWQLPRVLCAALALEFGPPAGRRPRRPRRPARIGRGSVPCLRRGR